MRYMKRLYLVLFLLGMALESGIFGGESLEQQKEMILQMTTQWEKECEAKRKPRESDISDVETETYFKLLDFGKAHLDAV